VASTNPIENEPPLLQHADDFLRRQRRQFRHWLRA
jgi:hypothetical protein